MNLVNLELIAIKATGPFAATPAAPLSFPMRLAGPFILGIQISTSDPADTAFRITCGGQIFPDPVSQWVGQAGATPLDRWYRPASDAMIPVRIFVPGEGGLPNATLEVANKDATTDATVIVTLIVSAKPPDEMTLELLREMRQGLDRLPEVTARLYREALTTILERQSLPR